MLIAIMLLAANAPQATDADVSRKRSAYSTCLRTFTEKSASAKMSLGDFKAVLPDQCKAEAEAYKAVMLQSEKNYKVPVADTMSNFNEEVQDYRKDMIDRFDGGSADPG